MEVEGMEAGLKAITGTGPRERLLVAAIKLFASKGYSGTSVREIVEAAGLTKPALYYYFHSKEGVFRAMMQEAVAVHRAVMDEVRRAGGSASDRILLLCERVYRTVLDNIEAVRVIDAIYYGPREEAPEFDFGQLHGEFDAFLRGLVEEAIATGEFPRGDIESTVLALDGGFIAAKTSASGRCRPEGPIAPEDLRRVMGIILNGIRMRPEGRPEEHP
jgi:AcrR family transcriptional regulator